MAALAGPVKTPLILIAAVGRNGAIGREDALPWRIASDMRHFRDVTMGKPLILGRRTWQSIGRPLPGRDIIVVSADRAIAVPSGIELCRDPDSAVASARRRADGQGNGAVMVGGGAAIYRALIGKADRLDITEVDLAPAADAFFPPIDPRLWREVSRRTLAPEAGEDAHYAFVTYERR